jgi:BirA family biotin operon repressor/biotin-[acetyl-CoA-carboxylase] ligase
MFDLNALESALSGTVFAGKLHYAAVTASTNADALQAAAAGAADGAVFFADEQTSGRGRADHRWESAAGQGLYVSVLLRPQLPPVRLPLLPLAAGLATGSAVQAVCGLRADLRWPNDVLIGPRKVAGILVEARSEGAGRGAVAVGIGINVHQREFAPALSTPATSLDLESGRSLSRQELLLKLLKSLQAEVALLENGSEEIPRRVAEASSWIEGRRVEVHGPQACCGVTAGLDPHGFLQVLTASGLVVVQTGGIRALA